MKYTLIDVVNDKTLAVVDMEEPTLSAVQARLRGRALLVKNKNNVSFYLCATKAGVCTVATPFGQLTVRVERGEQTESQGSAIQSSKAVKSSMPGKVVRIMCKEGDVVTKNQPILIIEAMKMENEIRAPLGGVVGQIAVAEGKKVETGELLVKITKT